MTTTLPARCPASVAPLPPRGSRQGGTFSMAIDTAEPVRGARDGSRPVSRAPRPADPATCPLKTLKPDVSHGHVYAISFCPPTVSDIVIDPDRVERAFRAACRSSI